jgi:FAD binding domain
MGWPFNQVRCMRLHIPPVNVHKPALLLAPLFLLACSSTAILYLLRNARVCCIGQEQRQNVSARVWWRAIGCFPWADVLPSCLDNPPLQNAGVLVAGGGPAGYCAAIALAQHGCTDIVVIERNPSADYYEPALGYVYCLFPHGKDVLRDLGCDDCDHAGAHRHVLVLITL